MKKLLPLLIVAVMALTAVTPGIALADSAGPMGPAPNSGDGIPDGSGFDGPNGPVGEGSGSGHAGPAPNSGDGTPDGSGF